MEFSAENGLIGREKDLYALHNAWKDKYRVFVIHGQKLVGKSRLVQEFLSQISHNGMHLSSFDFNGINNIDEFREILFQDDVNSFTDPGRAKCTPSCDKTDCNRCMFHLVRRIKSAGKTVVFWFDHLEQATRPSASGIPKATEENLYDLTMRLFMNRVLKECPNARLVISSTNRFAFSRMRTWTYRLAELDSASSLALLRKTSGIECDSSDHDSCLGISKLCGGLPLAIVNAGLLIQPEDDEIMSPKDVLEVMIKWTLDVLSHEMHPTIDKLDFNMHQALLNLSPRNQNNLLRLVSTICVGKGFRKWTLADMAVLYGYKETELPFMKWEVLQPLYNRNLIRMAPGGQTVSLSSELFKKYLKTLTDTAKFVSEDLQARIVNAVDKMENAKKASEGYHGEEDSIRSYDSRSQSMVSSKSSLHHSLRKLTSTENVQNETDTEMLNDLQKSTATVVAKELTNFQHLNIRENRNSAISCDENASLCHENKTVGSEKSAEIIAMNMETLVQQDFNDSANTSKGQPSENTDGVLPLTPTRQAEEGFDDTSVVNVVTNCPDSGYTSSLYTRKSDVLCVVAELSIDHDNTKSCAQQRLLDNFTDNENMSDFLQERGNRMGGDTSTCVTVGDNDKLLNDSRPLSNLHDEYHNHTFNKLPLSTVDACKNITVENVVCKNNQINSDINQDSMDNKMNPNVNGRGQMFTINQCCQDKNIIATTFQYDQSNNNTTKDNSRVSYNITQPKCHRQLCPQIECPFQMERDVSTINSATKITFTHEELNDLDKISLDNNAVTEGHTLTLSSCECDSKQYFHDVPTHDSLHVLKIDGNLPNLDLDDL